MDKWMLCSENMIAKILRKMAVNYEGGQTTSITLREYVKARFNVEVGKYTYGSCFSQDFNMGGKKVVIGNYCSFGANVRYFGANHPLNSVIMSPYFYSNEFGGFNVHDVERHELHIGNDVWFGYNSTVVSGCKTIGNGSVIATGAVVTKDVPSYSIVGGVPAKIIKYRFDEETIKVIEDSRWWEMTPENLIKFYDLIQKPQEFAKGLIDGG